jgi:glycosyltransferase involved in cell wall biosynthesis
VTATVPRRSLDEPLGVLHAIPWPVFGGPHNEAFVIARNAPRSAWRVVVTLPHGAAASVAKFATAGLPTHTLPLTRLRRTVSAPFWALFPFRFLRDVVRLSRLIREENIAVVDGSSVNIQPALAARLAGVACVWRIIDVSAPAPIRHIVSIAIERLADHILVNGRATLEAYPWVRRGRVPITVYFPMIDEDAFRASTPTYRDSGPYVVGTVANINPDKGIDIFVEAAVKLAGRTDVSFLVVGSEHDTHAAYARAVRERARAVGEGRVIFAGSQDNVASWMNQLDVFVVSSRREGTTTTLVEAMAAGLPIVATAVGAIHELIHDGDNGQLVAAEDPDALASAIAALLDRPDIRRSLGNRASDAYRASYSLERLLEARLATYRRAVASRRASNSQGRLE